MSSAILYLVVGVGPQSASGPVLLSGLAELVYHWNVRTPHWFGYISKGPRVIVFTTRRAFIPSTIRPPFVGHVVWHFSQS